MCYFMSSLKLSVNSLMQCSVSYNFHCVINVASKTVQTIVWSDMWSKVMKCLFLLFMCFVWRHETTTDIQKWQNIILKVRGSVRLWVVSWSISAILQILKIICAILVNCRWVDQSTKGFRLMISCPYVLTVLKMWFVILIISCWIMAYWALCKNHNKLYIG